MYKTVKKTRRFDTDKENDLKEFDRLLNNPNITILTKDKEKVQEKNFDEEGNMLSIQERIVWIVSWEEKQLC